MDYCGGKRLCEIECHRLLESELEADWLRDHPAPQRYNDLLKDFERDKDRLHEIASTPIADSLSLRDSACGVPVKRILRCYLSQNSSSPAVFKQDTAGRKGTSCSTCRLRVISARSLLRPFPSCRLSSRALSRKTGTRSATSSWEQALTSLNRQLCGLAQRLSQFPARLIHSALESSSGFPEYPYLVTPSRTSLQDSEFSAIIAATMRPKAAIYPVVLGGHDEARFGGLNDSTAMSSGLIDAKLTTAARIS